MSAISGCRLQWSSHTNWHRLRHSVDCRTRRQHKDRGVTNCPNIFKNAVRSSNRTLKILIWISHRKRDGTTTRAMKYNIRTSTISGQRLNGHIPKVPICYPPLPTLFSSPEAVADRPDFKTVVCQRSSEMPSDEPMRSRYQCSSGTHALCTVMRDLTVYIRNTAATTQLARPGDRSRHSRSGIILNDNCVSSRQSSSVRQ
jgi:hypothetical protein